MVMATMPCEAKNGAHASIALSPHAHPPTMTIDGNNCALSVVFGK